MDKNGNQIKRMLQKQGIIKGWADYIDKKFPGQPDFE